jgi:predicted alpha/beta-fold hydrolase
MTGDTARTLYTPGTYRPLFTGGHRQTLWAWARRRRFPSLPEPDARYFDVDSDARVLAHCHWQAERQDHPAFILLHGLEGSSMAHYMAGIADKAWRAGWNVVRLNQRNCGGTEHLSRGLYHSGLTGDPLHVLREIIAIDRVRAVVVAGYSLGGNLALKMAGDLAEHTPPELKAVCAVSPTMDLARCVDALERRQNIAYQFNFVRNLKRRMRRKARAFPDLFDVSRLGRVWTVRQFDEQFTAPHHGFRDAADYYHRASALRVVDRIVVPTLIVTAADDPFVPPEPFTDPAIRHNRAITSLITPSGGHCAYLAVPAGEFDGYWVEQEIVRFGTHHAAGSTSARVAAAAANAR